MNGLRMIVALSVATLATACASPGAMHGANGSPGMAHMKMGSPGSPGSTTAMDPRMKTMQEMHQKMMDARTPADRQALMAEHMQAMQGGMAMMKGMPGAGGMGMPADMAGRHQMMADHTAMMQMMMDMMADRMPPATATK